MIIYTVKPGTEETRRFATAVFVDTLSGIYVETPGDGFYKHPTFTRATLAAHLDRLKKEGFKVRKTTACGRCNTI